MFLLSGEGSSLSSIESYSSGCQLDSEAEDILCWYRRMGPAVNAAPQRR